MRIRNMFSSRVGLQRHHQIAVPPGSRPLHPDAAVAGNQWVTGERSLSFG